MPSSSGTIVWIPLGSCTGKHLVTDFVRVPIQVALYRKLPVSYIVPIVQAYKGILHHHVDLDGHLQPVDIARKERSSNEIVQYLAMATFPAPPRPPSGSGGKTKSGHIWPAVKGVENISTAIEYCMWDRVMLFANEQRKGRHTLSEVTRRDDKLPLHLAVINHAPLSVMHLMVRLYPAARAVKDSRGLKPQDYAIRMKLDSQYLDLLDEAHVLEEASRGSAATAETDIPSPEEIDTMSHEELKAACTRLANLLRHERSLHARAVDSHAASASTETSTAAGRSSEHHRDARASSDNLSLDDGLL